jgi:mono/diheme cytochrome c family protein
MKFKVIGAICFLLLALVISCQSDESIEFDRYYSSGSLVYQNHCQNCHGTKGEGLAGLIPPLTDSAYFKINKAKLACAVKFGLKAKLNIAGKSFEGEMPPATLTPIEIAQVLTFITNSYGSKLGIIDNQQVEDDLSKCVK